MLVFILTALFEKEEQAQHLEEMWVLTPALSLKAAGSAVGDPCRRLPGSHLISEVAHVHHGRQFKRYRRQERRK